MILEEQCSREIADFFRRLERKIHKVMEKHWESELGLFHLNKVSDIIQDSRQEYYDILFKYCKDSYMKGRESTERRFNRQLENISMKADVNITRLEDLFKPDPTIRYNLNSKVFQASAHTMDRVDNRIMENITQSYNDGLGIDEAKDRLTIEYNGLKSWEAQRIARTEINSAQNDGAFDVYGELGVEYHQWWTAQDERVRETPQADHRKMHGKIVKVGTAFSNGLMYPGDRQGSISQWINCRCTTLPFLMPLGKMAPVGMTEFTEEDLIDIPNFEMPTIDDLMSASPNRNIHLNSNLNPLERGRNAIVTDIDHQGLIGEREFESLVYPDGTKIEFERIAVYNSNYRRNQYYHRLKSVTIDGKRYDFLGDDSYDHFMYQLEDIARKYGDAKVWKLSNYSSRFATTSGMGLNVDLRNGMSPRGGLAQRHPEFVKLIKEAKLKGDIASYRVQTSLYDDDGIDKLIITSKSHFSTSTGALKGKLKFNFIHGDSNDGKYWQIITVIPDGSDQNALFLGNFLRRARGGDWEYELNFAPNQRFQRLLVDEVNKIIIQTPIG